MTVKQLLKAIEALNVKQVKNVQKRTCEYMFYDEKRNLRYATYKTGYVRFLHKEDYEKYFISEKIYKNVETEKQRLEKLLKDIIKAHKNFDKKQLELKALD